MLSAGHPETDDSAPRSQASLAYEAIRAAILSGLYRPDAKLKVQEIALGLEISAGAVREALSRLVPEQLVVSRDQRGFAVAPLSIADLEDLTDLRCEIEAIALRKSIIRGDATWEAGILASAHLLKLTPLKPPEFQQALDRGWVSAHAAFHHALVAAAGSRRLINLHRQLFEQSERYRGLSAHYIGPREVANEHEEIVEHALARNADAAVAAMTHHIRETTRLIILHVATGIAV